MTAVARASVGMDVSPAQARKCREIVTAEGMLHCVFRPKYR